MEKLTVLFSKTEPNMYRNFLRNFVAYMIFKARE